MAFVHTYRDGWTWVNEPIYKQPTYTTISTGTGTGDPVEIKAPSWTGDPVVINSPITTAPEQPEKPDQNYAQGWVCPKCGRVNAPWVATCPCYLSKLPIGSYDKPIITWC